MPQPSAPAITHVALTVSDLDRSVAWYTALWGAAPIFTGPFLESTPHHYTAAVWVKPNLGLHHFAEQADGSFSERRAGLDHVAFGCDTVEELHAWVAHLDSLGVPHGEILAEPYGHGLSFRDPDGIALELFVPAPR
jgi:glyoxylase I family protein